MLEINPVERIDVVSRIAQINQRIAKIEESFPVDGVGNDFQTTLDKELARQDKVQPTQATPDAKPMTAKLPVDENGFVEEGKVAVAFGLNRTSTTDDLITTSARKYGVDPSLVRAVAIAESNMDQREISPVGAIGVMQLMPDTAAALGVNPYDEAQNIEGGTKYLRQMLDKFGGNVPHALAAYNAGPAAVQKYGGIPPYKETQNYVGRIMDIVTG